jgi:hypothetical protein
MAMNYVSMLESLRDKLVDSIDELIEEVESGKHGEDDCAELMREATEELAEEAEDLLRGMQD